MQMNHDSRCPVCNSSSTKRFLTRQRVPVHQNLVMKDADSAVGIMRGDLNLHACADCGFVFNQSFDPAKLSYNAEYDNTQTCSAAFTDHVDNLVRYIVEEKRLQNCRFVEVGCGKGLFLRKLVEVA